MADPYSDEEIGGLGSGPRYPVADHEHIDGSGEGYCSCDAERCSLPGCDGYCVHPGGWIELAELRKLRRPSAEAYLRGIAPAQGGDVLDDLWWEAGK